MARITELKAFYDGWEQRQRQLLESLRPLSPEQMQLQAEGVWQIWRLASNMAGGRLYWLCHMLGEDDRGVSSMFRVEKATTDVPAGFEGWEDDENHPRSAQEIELAFLRTWEVIESCLDRWQLADMNREVTSRDAWGRTITITPGSVLWRLMSHEVHHSSEIATVLRAHGLQSHLDM